jgi:hypothetical protein
MLRIPYRRAQTAASPACTHEPEAWLRAQLVSCCPCSSLLCPDSVAARGAASLCQFASRSTISCLHIGCGSAHPVAGASIHIWKLSTFSIPHVSPYPISGRTPGSRQHDSTSRASDVRMSKPLACSIVHLLTMLPFKSSYKTGCHGCSRLPP